ncbi:membrane metallo-endopeptidase-like 1 [Aphidius gifuensis]|uniref:membrane metallo-endopeptidase-like 1 n=1 Tax=Aphidius gifuensis TaxID=684658 RepID=UPI001CDBCEF2|nr:membrane metallo-endopeptidase-like 1 [Aphidius gifuensis]
MKKPRLVILLVFLISKLVFGYQPSSDANDAFDVCETQACVNAASRIIKMGNPSVEPCEDFYEFACGGFLNSTESTRNSIEIDSFTEVDTKFYKRLEKILEQNITTNDFKYLKLAKSLYKICSNKIDIFVNSMEPSGGWPVLKGSNWNENLLNSTVTKRTLANYVMHKHLRDSDLLINLLSPHYEQCAEFVSTKLPIAVGAIYVQSYNRSWIMNAKDNISKMTLKIKEKFCEIIKEADGIDQETKKRMEEKLQLTTHIIGRLNDFTNNTKVDKFHEDFELFYEDNFFDAAIQLLVKNMTRDDHIWFYSALSMTYSFTMFDPSSNRTSISYTFPESEFFDSEQPNYINYGAMGYLIGDLIAKILNNYGSHFDLYELDPDERAYDSLWTLTSTRNFKNKSKCFIEQYSNYKVKELGLNLNGRIFRNINVADHGGIKAAYRAYNDLSTSDQRLPGLSYTPKQMFWIRYANMWCQKTTPELLKKYINREYPPNKFRVIGPLSNMPEFAKDFKCPSGSNMNPVKKCPIW